VSSGRAAAPSPSRPPPRKAPVASPPPPSSTQGKRVSRLCVKARRSANLRGGGRRPPAAPGPHPWCGWYIFSQQTGWAHIRAPHLAALGAPSRTRLTRALPRPTGARESDTAGDRRHMAGESGRMGGYGAYRGGDDRPARDDRRRYDSQGRPKIWTKLRPLFVIFSQSSGPT
jgi:hypothetical protein